MNSYEPVSVPSSDALLLLKELHLAKGDHWLLHIGRSACSETPTTTTESTGNVYFQAGLLDLYGAQQGTWEKKN